ncbi:MAG: hypothetical protein AAFX50_16305, partial [Acidobacteriota bacterium]
MSAADLTAISAEERRILQVLTPHQARAYSKGAAPEDLLLADGRSLQDFLEDRAREVEGGLVLKSIGPCVLFDRETFGQQTLRLHGQERDYSPHGGSAEGCGIPGLRGEILRTPTARALLVSVHVRDAVDDGVVKIWPLGGRKPDFGTLAFRGSDPLPATLPTLVVTLCDEESRAPCREGDLFMSVEGSPVRVTLTVLGVFEPAPRVPVDAAWIEADVDRLGRNLKSTLASSWELGPNDELSYSNGDVAIG